LFNTAVLTMGLAVVHPLLPLVLLYDYYGLTKYMGLLNKTLINVVLSMNKRKAFKQTLNFLGYWKKPTNEFESISGIKYVRKVENKYLDPNRIGMLPSMIAMQRLYQKYISQEVRLLLIFMHFQISNY